jgi:hypothetical protein
MYYLGICVGLMIGVVFGFALCALLITEHIIKDK